MDAVGSLTLQRRIERGIGLVVLIALSCLFIVPFIIQIGDSLKTFQESWRQPRIWIPSDPQWENFRFIFEVLPFDRFLLNTVAITCIALVGQITSACLVAYSFARLRWPGRRRWLESTCSWRARSLRRRRRPCRSAAKPTR